MTRLMLTDEHWSKLRTIMRQHGIYDKPNLRKIVEGILYRMRVGCPWRDLPSRFGFWNSVYQQFNRWLSKNKLMKIFKSLVDEPDLEWEFIDGSMVKTHQHSTGAASNEDEAIGKSVAGNTTKILMGVDAHGLPINFEITGVKFMIAKLRQNFLQNFPMQTI
jgi:transposase